MRLPEDFPHTRREQYLVALPEDLQTVEELDTGTAVLRRLRRFYDSELARHVADRWPAEPSEADIVIALAGVFAPIRRHARWRRGPLAHRRTALNRSGDG
jgi:hypothetical protein